MIFLILSLIFGLSSTSASAASGPATSPVESAVQRARELKLAEDRTWRKLTHYTSGLFGTSSQVDGPTFFLAKNGKSDPEAELEATLRGFFSPIQPRDQANKPGEVSGDDTHPICRFPARHRLLSKMLGLDPRSMPRPDCARFVDYQKRLQAQSASLVFSSFYLNNPSSAFGHSFLRINSRRSVGAQGEKHELLDHGINYAATVTTANPFLYAIYGMIGVFPGTFTSVPYYYKVREYNDYEARDLWSYDLALTPDEIEMLVAHVWELGPTYYDYFYFTENCSYHMFTTLEAAAPRLRLVDRIPYFVIPSDTMRALSEEPGLVTGIGFRPSVRAQFDARLKLLDESEVRLLKKIVLDRDAQALASGDAVSKASRARVYDAALDYLEFKHPEDLLDLESQNAATEGGEPKKPSPSALFKQSVLIARAQLGVRSEPFKAPPPSDQMPHLGHGVRRMSLIGGTDREQPFAQLNFRFALHDMLDPPEGKPKAAQLEFGNISARYQPEQKTLRLQDLTLFRVTSLSPITSFKRNISFRVDLGYHRMQDRNCDDCGAIAFEAGPGVAAELDSSGVVTAFAFADFQIAHSTSFRFSKWRLGAGPSAGFLFTPGNHWRAMVLGGYKYLGFSAEPHSYEASAELRYNWNKWFALGGRAQRYMDSSQFSGSALFYW